MKTSILTAILLATAGLGAAFPATGASNMPTRTLKVQPRYIGTLGVEPSGALGPTPAGHPEANDFPPAPPLITLVVANKAGVALTTTHGLNTQTDGVIDQTPQGGLPTAGTMAAGATKTLLYPTGWGGNIAFNNAKYRIQGDETLIESSFKIQSETETHKNAGFAINVSLVNGFTYPITCYCTSDGGAFLKGCSEKLWLQSTCPASQDNGQGACKNPLRDVRGENLEPNPFFKPCKDLAYVFPDNNKAVSNGALSGRKEGRRIDRCWEVFIYDSFSEDGESLSLF
ncbi:hypothetical protein OQA88_10602 [Cercophora sp. LCS_1]